MPVYLYAKKKTRRNKKSFKSCSAIFTWYLTHAIQLNSDSDLSTSTFLAVLNRFVARRGNRTELFSVCTTNFEGAYKEF